MDFLPAAPERPPQGSVHSKVATHPGTAFAVPWGGLVSGGFELGQMRKH